MKHAPFYDPTKTYEENYDKGPFAAFADGKVYKQHEEPKFKVFGIPVFSPFGIAAGPLINGKYVIAALDKGFDIPVYKTVRTRKYPCSLWPNVVPLDIKGKLTLAMQDNGVIVKKDFDPPLTITNSFGVPSQQPDIWQKDMAKAAKYAKKGQFVIGSFQGTITADGNIKEYINDFALGAKLVKQTGVKALEANLSCPNEGTSHLLCFDIPRSRKIVETIKNEIGETPLIIKIAYYKNHNQLKKLVKALGKLIQGIATINTMPAKIYDKNGKQALPGNNRLISGTCGFGVKWAGLEMTKRLIELRKELGLSYAIFGTGGVMKPKGYKEYKDLEADVVMTATGAMWNPYLAQEIKNLHQTSFPHDPSEKVVPLWEKRESKPARAKINPK